MNGNNNNPSIYEVEMSEDSDDNRKRTTETHDDFSLASPLGWITEVLIRLIMGAILLISYIVVDPFIRYVEPSQWHHYNYPHKESDTVTELALFLSIILVPPVITLSVILYSYCCKNSGWREKYKNGRMKKRILSEIIVAFLAFSMSYLATGLITDITKNLYGRPRPDFLSRCFGPKDISDQKTYWITLPSNDPLRANALTSGQKQALALYNSSRAEPQGEYKNAKNKNFPYIEDIAPIIEWFDCINDNEKLIVKEGRRSFPSGHTSFIFAGAVFCALYSGYWLGTWRSSLALGMGSKSRNFPGVSAKLATVFVFLLPAIYVGASRTQDYRHHPTDVIAGAIIGSVTTFITFFQYYSFRRMWR
ncbi:unnamed protein product [Oikopleura dioica]|uniref:Phosphatidic acid phosphatase type 2/haloperoxidase domain-containing protein n=1 Tax=Oikopleura dioica TaxID=34765 RepID=E4WYU9_OIKDI|nr:unnamed protein product [Oikopleura dioica]